MADKKLLDSKHFCMMPWIHMHMIPNGMTYPCCMAKGDMPVGIHGNVDLKELWNSKTMKNLRLSMLSDQPNKICEDCYQVEAQNIRTLRNESNQNFTHHWSRVESTKDDGSVDEMQFNFFDIRFNNVCNFRCRTCGPALSSAWAEEMNKNIPGANFPPVIKPDNADRLMNELLDMTGFIEEIHFAGGEPFVTPEIYQIMDKLLEHGRTDIPITWITNFSLLENQGKNLFSYWNKFKNTKIKASLDASGHRGEYLRKGTKWKTIIENRKALQNEAPHVKFELAPTISAYNIHHFPDFLDEWLKEGFVQEDGIQVTLLTFPRQMRATILPEKFKLAVTKKYEDYFKIWKNPQLESALRPVIDYMNGQDDSEFLRDFFRENVKWDKMRSEDIFLAFPELREARP